MNAVSWFEIPSVNLPAAKKFYEAALGVSLSHVDMGDSAMEMFASDPRAPGCGGAVVAGEGYTPSGSGSVVYFEVDDIDSTLGNVDKAGGRVVVPKTNIGEFGFIGMFLDTEGNRLGLHSMK